MDSILLFLKDEINNRLSSYEVNEELIKKKFSEFLYDFSTIIEFELSNIHFNAAPNMKEYGCMPSPEPLTIKQCIEDIEVLFKCLKYFYACYEFFGGDNVFYAAKESIINKLNNLLNISFVRFRKTIHLHESDGKVSVHNLHAFLLNELSFIKDSHLDFMIKAPYGGYFGGNPSWGMYGFIYTYENDFFNKEDNGFTLNKDYRKYKLIAVDNDTEIHKYIKPSIDIDGNLVMILCKYAAFSVGYKLKCQLTLKDTEGNQCYNDIELIWRSPATYKEKSAIKYDVIDNIPIVTNRTCIETECDYKLMIETASKCNSSKVSILDIRGNGGGSENMTSDWVKTYARQKIQPNRIGASMNSDYALDALSKSMKRKGIAQANINKAISARKQRGEICGWTPIFTMINTKQIQNENTLVVLIDNSVASAGEGFVNMLRQIKNVIFIGMNTRGCELSCKSLTWMLPNSTILITNGSFIFMKPDLINTDGIGYQPDVFVPTCEDMLQRVIKFIKKYLI